MYFVDNAVIMAAGTSSRFAPLSFEKPKALIEVKGEVLIERQIKQLKEAGIKEIYIVVGYKHEQFTYLAEKYDVHIVINEEYLTRNNNGSIYAVKDILKNTYICSADNYFLNNPFECKVEESYYAALYADGTTNEWCMQEDKDGYISEVTIGGENSWYMLGHVFWDERFSKKFIEILEAEYYLPETRNLLWESIFINHLSELQMKIRKYEADYIFEFDTLDELRIFDSTYKKDTRSNIMKKISENLCCSEEEMVNVTAIKAQNNEAAGFEFDLQDRHYRYIYETECVERI